MSGLDPKAAEDMYRMIDSLHREGITILMVTHDLAAAVQYATHILHIGDPIFFGKKDAYLQSPSARSLHALKGGERG